MSKKSYNNIQKTIFVNELLVSYEDVANCLCYEEHSIENIKSEPYYSVVEINGIPFSLFYHLEQMLCDVYSLQIICDKLNYLSMEDCLLIKEEIAGYIIENKNKDMAKIFLDNFYYDDERLSHIASGDNLDDVQFYDDMEIESGDFELEISTTPNYFDDSINLINIMIKFDGYIAASLYYGSLSYANNLSVYRVKNADYSWCSDSVFTLPKFFLKECYDFIHNGVLYEMISVLEDMTTSQGHLNFKLSYKSIYESLECIRDMQHDYLYDLYVEDDLLYALEEGLRKKHS